MRDPVPCSLLCYLPVKTVLFRIRPDVVVGAEAEGEVALVVGRDVKHHRDYRSLK